MSNLILLLRGFHSSVSFKKSQRRNTGGEDKVMKDELITTYLDRATLPSPIEELADELLALKNDSRSLETLVRGKRLTQMTNEIKQEVLGLAYAEESKQGIARRLIKSDVDEFMEMSITWGLSETIPRSDLIEWLKLYYGIKQYAKEHQLGTEFYRHPKGVPSPKDGMS